METDQHIEFFWTALEMFTQEELCKFIKFACNQERIPFTCPCKDGGPDTAHVPPYPMKIAPPDGAAGNGLNGFSRAVIGHEGCYLYVTFFFVLLVQKLLIWIIKAAHLVLQPQTDFEHVFCHSLTLFVN